MQIKTTVRYHLTTVRMAIINVNKQQVLARLWRKGKHSALLVGMQTEGTALENSMEFPQNTKNGTTQQFHFWEYTQRILKHQFKKTYAPQCS